MGWLDTWHRNSLVYTRLMREYNERMQRMLSAERSHNETTHLLEATLDAVRLELREARQALDAEKGRYINDAAQRVELMQECERLKFENENQERLIDTLKQTIYDHEQTITRLTAHDVAPKRTKRPVPPPALADIVILEERDTKIKPKTDKAFREALKKSKAKAKPAPKKARKS